MIERLLSSNAPEEETEDEEQDETGDEMKLHQHPEHHGFYDLCRKNPSR